jgi:hypothetical protein
MNIRKAQESDLPEILALYEKARAFMAETGNPHQWGDDHYPSESILKNDIRNGNLYVGVDEEDSVHFVFAFILGKDPTYSVIEDGAWLDENPYGTIHRIASDHFYPDVLGTVLAFALAIIPEIRADTHQDNLIMQKALLRHGFQRVGIIYVRGHSPRIAYQRTGTDQETGNRKEKH